MSIQKNNPDQILDQAIAGIRAEEMNQATVEQAAARVWANLSQTSVSSNDGVLRTCADFRALIPAYQAKQLPDAQAWLVEDHLHGCPSCRAALEATRTGNVVSLRPAVQRIFAPQWKWAMAAALAVGVGLGAWQMRDNLLPAPPGPRGVVQSVDGALYRVSGTDGVTLAAGMEIGEREEIRTARGSVAIVRLADGSLVEMRERSELSLSRRFSGTTISLQRGSVIVQAARQRTGRLNVATGDCLVSVKGTIFAVDRGTKGSRVSVIQGEVQVAQANQTQLLHPGQQTFTDATMAPVAVKDDISWSQNLNQYLTLLGEFAVMEKQLAQVPGPGLRYSSRLLDLAPDGTVLYVAIPNVGGMLGDAQRIFEDRLNQSQVLRDWWNAHQSPDKVKQVFDTVQGFSQYLGSEVVMTMAQGGSNGFSGPLIMAEVTQSGFRDYLQQQIAQVPAGAQLTVVQDASALPAAAGNNAAFVLLTNNIVAMSPGPASLRAVAALIQQPGSGAFAKTSFYQQIADAYKAGAGWLVCADMEQILPQSVAKSGEKQAAASHSAVLDRLGVFDLQHLIVQRKEIGGKTENRAMVTFAQPRRGMASWLAAPAPMGALDFVSPDASFAVAFVVKQPRAALEELFSAVQSVDPNVTNGTANFEAATDINLLDDLVGPLGGEVAFTLDGPVLPVPSWKFALEVYDPARLEHTIETLLAKANSSQQKVTLTLTQTQAGGRTYYALRSGQSPFEVDYTFVDGYLVAAASQSLLTQAISQRATGYTLARSAGFKALVAPDGFTNFSAILYQNLGSVLGPLADGLRATGALSADQQKSLDALKANSAPSLVYAYGEPDRIEVASTGSFFGLNLDALAGAGGPFRIPSLLGNVTRMHPTQ
jgi:ferric-dicitrate binding protein FerR (iron transport regulator)